MEANSLIVLLKGPNGAGKTETGLGFAQLGPLLVVQGDANSSTYRRARDRGLDVQEIFAKEWEHYHSVIVPHIVSRQVEKICPPRPDGSPFVPRTIFIDPYSSIADELVSEVIGERMRENLRPEWGKIFRIQKDCIRDLVFASKPNQEGTHAGYNIVLSSHLTDVFEGEGDKKRQVSTRAAVPGQFKDKWEKDFDYVLLLKAEIKREVVNSKIIPKKKFTIYSISPDNYNTCKGGDLPAELDVPEGESAFAVLNKHWNLK